MKVTANYDEVSRMAISKNARCDVDGAGVRRASFESSPEASAAPKSPSTTSGDPVPYLDAIEAAQLAATSGSALIAAVDAIVDDAGIYLSGVELEAVEAVASIAVETYDLWVTGNHVQAVADSIQPIYGSCLALAEDPPSCLYDASNERRSFPRSQFRHVNSAPQSWYTCAQEHFDSAEVAWADLKGGIAGALLGLVAGPGGATAGAMAGTVGVSVDEALDQAANYLHCLLS
jgi:hypothetical protein